MSSATKRLNEQIRLARSNELRLSKTRVARERIRALRELAMEMQRQLETLSRAPVPSVDNGIDFYEEVGRFEFELIKQALRLAEGHQTKAATLLNLKATTLNLMIKRYKIQVERFPESDDDVHVSSRALTTSVARTFSSRRVRS
jgi:transcriptional regulator with GAF, ATPase, and Fis domain